ncbi:hypothetical protein MM182_21670 [Aeromonas sp. MR19]|jgi:hypothetical protein|uniref:Uncharacterized protein n=1 Tax=Aeromonas bestiarum TaxID=105751 RepID=A0AAP4N2I8_9GAMM|nr:MULTISPECIES: hypothetical protein [Aeromonas]ATL97808.1 hypothetical protein CK910_04285 [Aeromonas sp. CA23]MCH7377947.1 hypothetical protein [Aeromonas sp. MR19]MDM5074469.1 hypothetical protein [Aeromonas bestiarum]MDM5091534.1 hypothetical protein [Aeromonas bestiarum]MDM5142785.1 hypothetical protein [Aeromonas bestiarum]
MMRHLIEINSSQLFEEYLQSLGVPQTPLDREQDIYLQERHLAAVRQIQGKMKFYLRVSALTKQ